MKILQSQQSLNKFSSNSGFIVSFFIHSALLVALFYAPPFLEIKQTKEKSIKIDLKSFEPIAAPVFAREAIPAPPEPIQQSEPKQPPVITPPKPAILPKPEPKPIPKHEPKPEQVKKPQPAPTPPQPVVITPSSTANLTHIVKQASAPVIGEYNMQNSIGNKNFDQIRRALMKHHKYPKNAVKMRKQGICEVRFLIKKSSEVTDVEVVSSSGTQILDDSAVETVKRAQNDFPKLENDIRVRIPITFKLN